MSAKVRVEYDTFDEIRVTFHCLLIDITSKEVRGSAVLRQLGRYQPRNFGTQIDDGTSLGVDEFGQ